MDRNTIKNAGGDGGHHHRPSWDLNCGAVDGPPGPGHSLALQDFRDLAFSVDQWKGQFPQIFQHDQLELQPTPQLANFPQQSNYSERQPPQALWPPYFQQQSQFTGLFPPQRGPDSGVQLPGPSAFTLRDYANQSSHQDFSLATSSTFFALIITQAALYDSSTDGLFSSPGTYRAVRGESIPQPGSDGITDQQYILTTVQGSVVNGIVHDEDTYVAFSFAPPPSGSGRLEEAECRGFLLRRVRSSQPNGEHKGKEREYIEPFYAISRIDHPIQGRNDSGAIRRQGTRRRGRPRTVKRGYGAGQQKRAKGVTPLQELEHKIRAAFLTSFKDLVMSINEDTVVSKNGVAPNGTGRGVGFGDAGPSRSMGRATGLGARPDSVVDVGAGDVGDRADGWDLFTSDAVQARQYQDNLEAFLKSNDVGVGEGATGSTRTPHHAQSLNGDLDTLFHPFGHAPVNEGMGNLAGSSIILPTVPPVIGHTGILSDQIHLPTYANPRENASYEDWQWPRASSTAVNPAVCQHAQFAELIHNPLEVANMSSLINPQDIMSTAFPAPATRTRTLRGAPRTRQTRGQHPYPSLAERQLQATPTRARMEMRGEGSSRNPRVFTPPHPLLTQPFAANAPANALHNPTPSFATGHMLPVDGNLHYRPFDAYPSYRAYESSFSQMEFQGPPGTDYTRR